MGDRKPTSKKRSTSNKRPRRGFTFYLCNCVDYDSVCEVLERNGIRFKRHRSFFAGETPDTDILKLVGTKHWLLVTADKKQRTRHLERQMILLYKVREFVITAADVGDVGELLVSARRKMRAICSKNEGPFVASISKSGHVTLQSMRQQDNPVAGSYSRPARET